MPAPKPDPLLELEARRRLFQLIQDYPGLHEREAARQLGTSQALVNFHRVLLEEHGLIRVERADGTVRLYARAARGAPTPAEQTILVALRNRSNLHLTLVLLTHGPAKHHELAEALGMGKSTVSFHLRKLEAAGVVAKAADGSFRLLDPLKVQQVLTRFKPTPDLLEEFTDLWSNLYGV